MSDLQTASYVAVPTAVHDDIAMTVREGTFARMRPAPDLCRCDDPQTVIVSTGPVLCRSCGRRVGEVLPR